jgi:hypothetical protein
MKPAPKPVCLLRSSFNPQEQEHLKREDDTFSDYLDATENGRIPDAQASWNEHIELVANRPERIAIE